MKKAFKILAAMRSIAIIALVAAIGFSMTACKDDAGDPDPNIITITDIPSIHVGKVGALMLSTSPTSTTYPFYSIDTISGSSFSFSMKDWINDSRPWDGKGNYIATIFIFNDIEAARAGNYNYAGVRNTDITGKTTTLAWSSFVQKAGLNFQVKIVR
jgi:hypothetical protein